MPVALCVASRPLQALWLARDFDGLFNRRKKKVCVEGATPRETLLVFRFRSEPYLKFHAAGDEVANLFQPIKAKRLSACGTAREHERRGLGISRLWQEGTRRLSRE